ncbi:MAG: prephenate dehydrogenase [Ignavibacteriales bacterium]|nr:prephenate dehydrogenase [Ignavibacteriales bacterium]
MKSASPFRRVTIVGVGLIGGSLGLAIRRQNPRVIITGVDRRKVLDRARHRGAINVSEPSLARAVENADLVILATPLNRIKSLLPVIARSVSSQALVTDVGSVKAQIMNDARMWFPKGNFIGGHPMAGSEHSGIQAAHPLLFENAIYVLTPLSKARVRAATAFVRSVGARPLVMDAGVHDAVVATVSHLPQLVAIALMNLAGSQPGMAKACLQLGAGGFRDMTRVASSPFELWKGIFPANRAKIQVVLRRLERMLAGYRRSLTRADLRKIAAEFRRSQRLRNRIPSDMKGFLRPLPQLEVFLPDRPGMLARLTGALARKNVNIRDIELIRVREGMGGMFRLSFESAREKERARRTLHAARFAVER